MNKSILILNWRSYTDKLSGGAELATFEHARRWVSRHGCKVIWISPPPKKGLKEEVVDGVIFNYVGFPFSRNLFALLFYFPIFYFLVFWNIRFKYEGEVDFIIDECHGLPFLTTLYTKKKVILYIHEVAGKIWEQMYPFPISYIGRSLEKLFLSKYKNSLCVTGTNSAKQELVGLGVPQEKVEIIRYAISPVGYAKSFLKESKLTLVFLNRVVKMKRIELAIEIFHKVYLKDKSSMFWIIGRGEEEYIEFLKEKCKRLGISESVNFWGFVDNSKKEELLSKAHVLINTSVKEGWGLVNIEANSQGTPAVAFDVPGNNESIIDGVTGFLVPEGDTDSMVQKILELKTPNKKLYSDCVEHSKKYDWDTLSDQFYEIFEK